MIDLTRLTESISGLSRRLQKIQLCPCVHIKRCEVLSGLHKEKLSWQTREGKLKLVCVNGTKTVLKHVGKLIATSKTGLYSRQLCHQLVSDV